MKELEIKLSKNEFYPGETGEAEVTFTTDKTVKTKSLNIRAVGMEHVEFLLGTTEHVIFEEKARIHLEEVYGNLNELPPGTYTGKLSFRVPGHVFPSYEGMKAQVAYAVEAWVDIPNWPDPRVQRPFTVKQYPTQTGEKNKGPFRFKSRSAALINRPGNEDPTFQVDIAKDLFYKDEIIHCKVDIQNPARNQLRRLIVRLKLLEVVKKPGETFDILRILETIEAVKTAVRTKIMNKSAERYQLIDEYETAFEIKSDQAQHDLSFTVQVPKTALSSAEGTLVELDWGLELQLDVALCPDPMVIYPIKIYDEMAI